MPARRASRTSHRVILGYARRFGVPMEMFVNGNRSAGWDFAGKVQPERRMVNDMRRAQYRELLAKAIDRQALDQEMPKGELEAFRQFLRFYGGLDDKGEYANRRRAPAFAIEPGGYARRAQAARRP